MVKHIDTLGILFLAYGVLEVLGGLVLVGVYLAMGLGLIGAGASGGDDEAVVVGIVMGGMSVFVGIAVLVMAVFPIVAGIGIRKRANWGRIMGFIAAVLCITSFPLGTALGVFAFVVLLDKDVVAEFWGGSDGSEA